MTIHHRGRIFLPRDESSLFPYLGRLGNMQLRCVRSWWLLTEITFYLQHCFSIYTCIVGGRNLIFSGDRLILMVGLVNFSYMQIQAIYLVACVVMSYSSELKVFLWENIGHGMWLCATCFDFFNENHWIEWIISLLIIDRKYAIGCIVSFPVRMQLFHICDPKESGVPLPFRRNEKNMMNPLIDNAWSVECILGHYSY